MRIEDDIKLDYKDVLIKPKRSSLISRSDVDINRVYKFKHCPDTFIGTGIIAANMDTTGSFAVAKVMQKHNLMAALHKFYSIEELSSFFKENYSLNKNMNIFMSLGISDDDLNKFQTIMNSPDGQYVRGICVDVANGYSSAFSDFIKKLRSSYPKLLIMAGNVTTGEMTEDIIISGADIVKVGIGPGSACTTRKITGVGYPQLSAIIECADAAHGVGGMICADGGCTIPGDVAKAFCAGADFVMLGGMLAGHDECNGTIIEKWIHTGMATGTVDPSDPDLLLDPKPIYKKKKFMKFYGMSSTQAQQKYYGGVKDYRASEGRCVEIPYRGKLEDTVKEVLGGVRSMMTYIGAAKLKEVAKRCSFVRVSQQLNEVFVARELDQ